MEMAALPRRATRADLEALPETVVGQIVDGDLIVMPRPASPHARAAGGLFRDLGPFDPHGASPPGPGGWWILAEPEVSFGDDVLVPDLAGWRRERMPVLPSVASFDDAPDWACEVLSPNSVAIDRVHKMRIYARAGLGHCWLVDPLARTLEVFRREGDRWLLVGVHAGDAEVRAEPFEALPLAIGGWWLPGSA